MVRVAASEDAHNVACLFGMLSMVAADGARRRKDYSLARVSFIISTVILGFYSRQSVLCFSWSLDELAVKKLEPTMFFTKTTEEKEKILAAMRYEPGKLLTDLGGKAPEGMRAECNDAIAGADRFIKWGDVAIGGQELPFIWYSRTVIPVGVWLLKNGNDR